MQALPGAFTTTIAMRTIKRLVIKSYLLYGSGIPRRCQRHGYSVPARSIHAFAMVKIGRNYIRG